MNNKINNKLIISSIIYKFIEKIGSKIVGFIIRIILARLLDPEVFGVIAIFMAIVAIMQTFVDSGMNIALIQNKTINVKDYSVVFYITFGIALILYIYSYITIPYFLSIFNMCGYEKQLRVLLIILFVYSFNSIQTAQLTREMKFKQIFICQLISNISSGIISILVAFKGLGIWALIIHYISNSIISCISYSFVTKWFPTLYFSFQRAKIFWGFGIKMLGSSLLTQLFTHIRTFTVGKVFSTSDLAYYSRGDQIPNLISSTLNSVFKAVMLPVYANKQDQIESLLNTLRKTIRFNSFLIFPSMFGLSALASSMVMILYTNKWIDCVPFVQVLSLANLSIAITSPCLVSIQAIGRSDSYFRLEIVRRIIMLGILVSSFLFKSLIAIAIGWLVSSFLDIFIVTWVVKKLLGYKIMMMLSDILPNIIMSIIIYIVIKVIGNLDINIMITFIVQLISGIISLLICSVLFRNPNFYMIKSNIHKLINIR